MEFRVLEAGPIMPHTKLIIYTVRCGYIQFDWQRFWWRTVVGNGPVQRKTRSNL